jgi:hypothetical protein
MKERYLMYDSESPWSLSKLAKLVTLFVLLIVFFATVANAQVINLPETGQTLCYAA